MDYASAIKVACEQQVASAFAVLVKGLASGETDAPTRFANALALIEQARVAALATTQQTEAPP